MKLIGVTGLPRSGKDSFADHLVQAYGYKRMQFSEPLKQAAAVLLNRPVHEMRGEQGFDREALLPEWGFTSRMFLQYLGTEGLRGFREDFWVHRMRMDLRMSAFDRIVITDVRFDNEVTMIHEMGGKVVQVWRPAALGSAHVSDAGVIADATVHNTGTLADLWAAADGYA